MADVSKVEYGGRTLVDLTNDTVTPETLAEGVTAHDASGKKITGTYVEPTPTYERWVFTMSDGTTTEKKVNVG